MMNARYRRGWFNESYRHYLAAKGIRTRQRYFAEAVQEGVPKPSPGGIVNVFRGGLRVGGPAKTAGKEYPERGQPTVMRAEATVEKRLGERQRLERKAVQQVKIQSEKEYADAVASRDPKMIRNTIMEQNKLLGGKDDAKVMNRVGALQAKLGELEFENARLGLPVSTRDLSPATKRDIEAFQQTKKTAEAGKEPTSILGQFARQFGERGLTELTRPEREAELIRAKRKEEELQLAEGAGIEGARMFAGWDTNPVVNDTRKEPFYGAFDPFEVNASEGGPRTYLDVGTPILDRSMLGLKTGARNPIWGGSVMGVDAVQKAVDEVYKAKKDLASADKTAFKRGKIAFQKGDREDLVKAIVELDSQGKKLDAMQALVLDIERQVNSPDYVQRLMAKDEGMFESPFGGSKASKLADDARKIAETKAVIREATNQVKGRYEDLNNKRMRMDAALPPQTVQPAGITEVFKEDHKQIIESPVQFAQDFLTK